jgi:hypothetical protein
VERFAHAPASNGTRIELALTTMMMLEPRSTRARRSGLLESAGATIQRGSLRQGVLSAAETDASMGNRDGALVFGILGAVVGAPW